MKQLIRRILRRLTYEYRKQEHKIHDRYGCCHRLASWRAVDYDLNEVIRVFPGAPKMLPATSVESAAKWRSPSYKVKSAELLAHRIRIFSDHEIDINSLDLQRKTRILEMASELPQSVTRPYSPIDWNVDFHSKHRWRKDLLYFDKRLAPRPNAEIKVPWELSRFVHVCNLGHCELAVGGHEFIMQVIDWISDNPRFKGVNWSSELTVAVRAINWIWGLQLFKPIVNKYPRVKCLIAESVYDHYLYLRRNLAYHELYSDDHYLGDLVGLTYICAAFPEFPESDQWLLFSILGLEDEMGQQILGDGYSHMMSSHYHRFVAEIFASGASLIERLPESRRDRLNKFNAVGAWPYVKYYPKKVINNAERILSHKFYEGLLKMGIITAAITKPNGLVPQLGDNDSARLHRFFGSVIADERDHSHIVSTISVLTGSQIDRKLQKQSCVWDEAVLIAGEINAVAMGAEIVDKPSQEVQYFPDSGIAVVRSGLIHLTVLCCPNGYKDGRGGHGHNDKLSFELNVMGVDFIVDGGCPFYTSDPDKRNAYRSTWAHNTAAVVGMEQDRLPENLFELPQKCQIFLKCDSDQKVSGYHTGYGKPHRRVFEVDRNCVIVSDTLACAGVKFIVFNVHPDIQVMNEVSESGDEIRVALLSVSGVKVVLTICGVVAVQEVPGFYGVGFGRVQNNISLRFQMNNNEVVSRFEIVAKQE